MVTIVSSKGQVTIPKPVRDRLGIEKGSEVEFVLAPDGSVMIEKVGTDRPASRFAKLRGRAGKGMTTEEIMEMTRGEA